MRKLVGKGKKAVDTSDGKDESSSVSGEVRQYTKKPKK